METIKLKIIQLLLNRFALGYLVKGWSSIKGYKTQIFAVVCVLVYVAETTGQIQHDLAEQLYTLFGGLGGMSFIQKLQRYQPVIDETVAKIKENSK